jgi:hypothetical protein
MSEDSENTKPEDQSTPADNAATPKPVVKKPVAIKASGNPFAGNAGNFTKGKSSSGGFKGRIFKGSGVKKGK